MKGYENWDKISKRPRIPADGYIMEIVGVEIAYSKNGNEMIKLAMDVHEGEYKGYFKELFKQKKESDQNAKWQCIFRQLTRGNSTVFFKRLISNIEKCNQGYDFQKTNFDEQTLKGKLIGFVFRDEEWENPYNKKSVITAQPYTSTTIDNIRNKKFKVPDPLLINDPKDTASTPAQAPSAPPQNDNDPYKDDFDVPF